MKMTVKIFLLPGLNKKTITQEIDLEPGASLAWLMEYIRKQYGMDLVNYKSFITILDGEAIEVEKNMGRNLEGSKEIWFMPQISGG